MATGIQAVKTALIANTFIFIMKLGAAILTRSAGMMAEAIHSLADAGNQVLLLLGYKRSAKAPDEQHPFGYGKEEYFWSFIVAILLFVLGSIYSLYEGIHKLLHPEELHHVYVNFAILGVSVVLESYSWYVAKKSVGGSSVSEIYRTIVESKDANAVVVFVEDTGALVGLAVALLGNVAAFLTGNPAFDAAASVVIGLLLLAMAYFLANEMRKLIIGESIDKSSLYAAQRVLARHPHVRHVGYMKSMQTGANSCLIAVRVDFEDTLTDAELEGSIASLTEEIKREVPQACDIFIQPSSRQACLGLGFSG